MYYKLREVCVTKAGNFGHYLVTNLDSIFNELNDCSQNSFVDVIFKLTVTVKNYSK